MKPWLKKSVRLGVASLLAMLLGSCAASEEAPPNFGGFQPGQVRQSPTVIHGQIQFKGFTGGEIFLEARETFPCEYGRCPVIEKPPLAIQQQSGPGPYDFPLTEIVQDMMLVVTYMDPAGGTRVAHTMVNTSSAHVNNVNLSLDRPYSPLR